MKKIWKKQIVKVHDKIPCLDLFFWTVTKEGDDNKIPIVSAVLQDARTNPTMNDSFENAKILNIQRWKCQGTNTS